MYVTQNLLQYAPRFSSMEDVFVQQLATEINFGHTRATNAHVLQRFIRNNPSAFPGVSIPSPMAEVGTCEGTAAVLTHVYVWDCPGASWAIILVFFLATVTARGMHWSTVGAAEYILTAFS